MEGDLSVHNRVTVVRRGLTLEAGSDWHPGTARPSVRCPQGWRFLMPVCPVWVHILTAGFDGSPE